MMSSQDQDGCNQPGGILNSDGKKRILSLGKVSGKRTVNLTERRSVLGQVANNSAVNVDGSADDEKLWHIREARRIQEAFPDAERIILQTGYGPSGEAHIGTLTEVIRTVMIAWAFRAIDGRPVKIQCFCDDQDGMRKVPPDVPNQEMMEQHLDKSLCVIPDPYGCCESYAEHNIQTLKKALKNYGLYNEVEFINSSVAYKTGVFNDALLTILRKHKEMLGIILPTLRDERRATYSPFMPVCPETGCVIATGVEEYRENTIVYRDKQGRLIETPVTDGRCKLQWHIDFGMRWAVFGVHYEMHGKDLSPSVRLAQQICATITGSVAKVPVGMMYELFLDENGEKISKSKGNSSLSVDTWYRIAPIGSLYYFVYQKPRTAKRLDIAQVPRYVDEFLRACESEESVGYVPERYRITTSISYQLLIQLASISHSDASVVLKMLERQGHVIDDGARELVRYACCFAREVLLNDVELRTLQKDGWERSAVKALIDAIMDVEEVPEKMQFVCYEVGKKYAPSLLEWFRVLYGGLFGAERGPRIGTFFAYIGKERALEMLRQLVQ